MMEDSFFRDDIRAVDQALEIVQGWNKARFIDRVVRLNKPEILTFVGDTGTIWDGQKELQQPFIMNFQKWNSNTGFALGLDEQ